VKGFFLVIDSIMEHGKPIIIIDVIYPIKAITPIYAIVRGISTILKFKI